MQFKHPELLYALLLLLIPIIVHLFQLRRFQKVPFTNVEFLKQVNIQTRKSQQLKKWLTLLTRLLLFAAIILAFAQPFTSKKNTLNLETETVIYLDNSFSMQAKGQSGELYRRAVQDILSSIDEAKRITLFTNNRTFKNTNAKTLRNELLQMEYSSTQLDYDATIFKAKDLFSKQGNTVKNLLLISDFQQNKPFPTALIDSSIITYAVPLRPVNKSNISIDSVYVSNQNASNIELSVKVDQSESAIDNVPISLFNNEELMAKTALSSTDANTATFTLPANTVINGKLQLQDANLQFDNTFYFNLNERPKINVLSINEISDDYLKRVFTDDEFNYEAVISNQLNFNVLEKQDLVILNELETIPTALNNAISALVNKDSKVLIIPSSNINLNTYNQLFSSDLNISIDSLVINEKKVTNINYSHPVFKDVFDKKVSNFQYPKVSSYYSLQSNSSPLLSFEDGKPFLIQSGNLFLFSAAVNIEHSNFINSPLIVPTLYNIGRQSLKLPQLYYTIGNENTFEVNIGLQQDDILKLQWNGKDIIPQQRTFTDKVVISTNETPETAGIYNINTANETIDRVSYNFNRDESMLTYHDLSSLENITINNSIPNVFDTIKSTTNINTLWKWFVIFALLLLIIEMLILKFLK